MTKLPAFFCGMAIVGSGVLFNLGTLSPVAPKLMALYSLAVMALGALAYAVWKGRPLTLTRFDLALGAAFAWAALSIAWSPDWRGGLYSLINIAVILAVYMAAKHLPITRTVTIAVTISVFIVSGIALAGVFALASPLLRGGFGNANFLAEYLMLASPFVAWLVVQRSGSRDSWLYLGVLAAVVYIMFFTTGSRMPYIGLLGVGVVAGWRYRRWPPMWIALGLLAAAAFYQWGSIGQPVIYSFMSRAEIWFNSYVLWAERPFIGWGLGGFAAEYDRVQFNHLSLAVFANEPSILTSVGRFVGEAHNEIVQIMVETGLIGIALVLTCGWLFIQEARAAKHINHFMLAVVTIAAAASLVEFPMHNPATSLLVAVAAGVLCRGHPPHYAIASGLSLPGARIPAAFLIASIGVALIVFGQRSYAAYIKMGLWEIHTAAMQNNRGGNPYIAFISNAQANDLMPLHPKRRRQLALSLGNLLKLWPKRVRITPEAADRAHQISTSAAPHTPGVMINRLSYLLHADRMDDPEIPDLLNALKRNAFTYPQYWILEGWYSIYRGYADRAQSAADKAKELFGGPSRETVNLEQAIDKVRNLP